MEPAMNPLLDFSGLPRFADIKTEHVTPAVDHLLAEGRAVIERVSAEATAATWHDFIEPQENANERLSRAWGQVGHLNAVMNGPELREVYNGNLPKLTEYYTELGQNEKLFNKNKAAEDHRQRVARFSIGRRGIARRKKGAL
jgi:oligopeptidase A